MAATSLPRPRLRLLSARTPDPLVEWAVTSAAAPGAPWTVVVPRTYLKRELGERLLALCPEGWMGERLLTLDEWLEPYAATLDGEFRLSPLQATELVEGALRDLDRAESVARWPGLFHGNAVNARALATLTDLCLALDTTRITPEHLEALASADPNPVTAGQKRLALAVYQAYAARLSSHGFYPAVHGRRLAADAAAGTPVRAGVERLAFLGLDGARANDPAGRLVAALAGPGTGLRELAVLLVTPDPAADSAWTTHGNDDLRTLLARLGRGRLRGEDLGGATRARAGALAALATDPTAYREPAVTADRSVRGARLSDPESEARWVMAEIKRRIVDGTPPEAIAVVGEGLGRNSDAFTRAARAMGVPVVASAETSVAGVPAVQALLALWRLAAGPWTPDVLLPVARSPYLHTGLPGDLLASAGAEDPAPQSPHDWHGRLLLLGPAGVEARAAVDRLTQAVETRVPQAAAPALMVRAVRNVLAHWGFEGAIYAVPDRLDERVLSGVRLTRADLDAVNALLRELDAWQRGREMAERAEEPVTRAEMAEVLERVAAGARVRLSSYARDAVHLVDPQQAIARQWPIVYAVGLATGMRAAGPELWTETERASLLLPSRPEAAARERLAFHLTCAAAHEELTLSYAATDARGGPVLPVSALAGLELRLAGWKVTDVSAAALLPTHAWEVVDPADVVLVAARTARATPLTSTVAPVRADALPGAPLLAPPAALDGAAWLDGETGRTVATRWRMEGARALARRHGVGALPDAAWGAWQGQIGEVIDAVRPPHVPFTPGQLELYARCRLRYYFAHVLRLSPSADPGSDDAGGDEAMAMGVLQHRILHALYRRLDDEGLLPVRTSGDLRGALRHVEPLTRRVIGEFRGGMARELWDLDAAPVLDLVRRFVTRDLERQLAIARGEREGVVTRPVGLELALGGVDAPVTVQRSGESWLLAGQIDRLERVDDVRLAAHPSLVRLQGLLVVRDYRSSRARALPDHLVLRDLTEGRRLQLPLLAHLASASTGQRVFALGDLYTSQGADGPELSVRAIRARADGTLVAERHEAFSGLDNPVETAVSAALDRATELVRGIRAGDFTPQPERNCWSCPFATLCRASKTQGLPPGALHRSRRAPLPLAVTRAELAQQFGAGVSDDASPA